MRPRSASVINLKNCENVTLEDFTAGHTLELGQCSSGVIYLQNCTGTDMNRLGIYGCGMIGLQAADSGHFPHGQRRVRLLQQRRRDHQL